MADSGSTSSADPIGAMTVAEFLARTAARTPAPGGGAAAGVAGALAAGLASMVVAYSTGRGAKPEHAGDLAAAAAELEAARGVMLRLADEDAVAYSALNELQKLPQTDGRRSGLPAALDRAVLVPRSVLAAALNMLRLFEHLAGITNPRLKSDLGIAALLAEAAARAARWNVLANAELIADGPARAALIADADRSVAEARARALAVETACGGA